MDDDYSNGDDSGQEQMYSPEVRLYAPSERVMGNVASPLSPVHATHMMAASSVLSGGLLSPAGLVTEHHHHHHHYHHHLPDSSQHDLSVGVVPPTAAVAEAAYAVSQSPSSPRSPSVRGDPLKCTAEDMPRATGREDTLMESPFAPPDSMGSDDIQGQAIQGQAIQGQAIQGQAIQDQAIPSSAATSAVNKLEDCSAVVGYGTLASGVIASSGRSLSSVAPAATAMPSASAAPSIAIAAGGHSDPAPTAPPDPSLAAGPGQRSSLNADTDAAAGIAARLHRLKELRQRQQHSVEGLQQEGHKEEGREKVSEAPHHDRQLSTALPPVPSVRTRSPSPTVASRAGGKHPRGSGGGGYSPPRPSQSFGGPSSSSELLLSDPSPNPNQVCS